MSRSSEERACRKALRASSKRFRKESWRASLECASASWTWKARRSRTSTEASRSGSSTRQRAPQLVDGLGPATLVDADLGAGLVDGCQFPVALGSDGDLAQQVGCLDQVLVCRIALPDLAMDDAGKTICAGRLEGHARLMARAGEEVLVEGQGVLQEPPPDRLEVGQVDQMLLADAHQHRLHGIHRAGEVRLGLVARGVGGTSGTLSGVEVVHGFPPRGLRLALLVLEQDQADGQADDRADQEPGRGDNQSAMPPRPATGSPGPRLGVGRDRLVGEPPLEVLGQRRALG